MRLHEIRR